MINLEGGRIMTAVEDERAPKQPHGATWNHLIVNSK